MWGFLWSPFPDGCDNGRGSEHSASSAGSSDLFVGRRVFCLGGPSSHSLSGGPISVPPLGCGSLLTGEEVSPLVFPLSGKGLVRVTAKEIERMSATSPMLPLSWLSGTLRLAEVVARLSAGDADDYDKVKSSLLKRYRLSAEAFRQRFRNASKKSSEGYSEFAYGLKTNLIEWLKSEEVYESRDKVVECVCLEQFFRSIPQSVKLWVQDRVGVDSVERAAELAEETDAHLSKAAQNESQRIRDVNGTCVCYKLEGSASTLLYSTDLSGGIGTAIEKSTAVDPEEFYAYFLTGKKVVRLPVGSCSIYESCSDCMNSTGEPLVCGWCVSKCAYFDECPPIQHFIVQGCPIILKKASGTLQCCQSDPACVNYVSPTKGPSTGGTLLTLEGDNFGSPAHKPDSSIQITVGNKPCALVHWNYTFVQCKTPAGKSGTLVDILVNVNDTYWDTEKSFDILDKKVAATGFQYQLSTFSGITPSYGPRAGGTSIALHGANLDSGASQTVSVGSHPCHIHSVTNVTILCSTSRLKGSHPGGDETHRVTLMIDGQEVPYLPTKGLTATFSYKPNPVVNKILPASATFKGRSKVLVLGENLDSVVKPVMVTRVTSLNNRHHENISKVCVPADDGHSLGCPVASLFDSSVIPRDELQNHKDPIWVQVHFQMDGLRLPERAPGMEFVYKPPPKFYLFPPGGLDVRADDPTVLIRTGPGDGAPHFYRLHYSDGPLTMGHNFEVLEDDDEFSVKIDEVDQACKVINITSTTIVCSYKIDEESEDAAHTVDVVMGNETFRLGTLKLVSGQASCHAGTIAGVVITIIVITLILDGAFFYYKRRQPDKRTGGNFVEDDSRNDENGGRPL
ncbi:hypothetical protein HPB47_017158 [Ixodes persulcatus]|uniref:Uncharacterized protein n=1 Tax=Ixodes persulcatus TaxID=34615 RepID=A0AC60QR17_IXOPE|nr:hypothetical protein HPB47_017158 [Ixodes persulcatus]